MGKPVAECKWIRQTQTFDHSVSDHCSTVHRTYIRQILGFAVDSPENINITSVYPSVSIFIYHTMLLHQSLTSPGSPTFPRFSRRRNSLISRRKIRKPLKSSSSLYPCVCLHINTEKVAEIAQNKVTTHLLSYCVDCLLNLLFNFYWRRYFIFLTRYTY